MQMQLSSGTQIPDGLLADIALRNEKPRLGVPSRNPALHQGINASNSTIVLGLQSSVALNRIGSRSTGKERDAESGLDYFGARYYGSNMGRFQTPDDGSDQNQSDPQSFNLYQYGRNNPVTNTDPTGNDCVTQTRTSSTTESVSVNAGNCSGNVGDGQTQTYVNGTVTSISVNGGNSLDIGYNSYDGQSSGVTNASAAPIPDRPGLAYGYGNNAQGYHCLLYTSPSPRD